MTLAENTEAGYEKLAKEGSPLVCPHLLLWPDDLLDMLSGAKSSHTVKQFYRLRIGNGTKQTLRCGGRHRLLPASLIDT